MASKYWIHGDVQVISAQSKFCSTTAASSTCLPTLASHLNQMPWISLLHPSLIFLSFINKLVSVSLQWERDRQTDRQADRQKLRHTERRGQGERQANREGSGRDVEWHTEKPRKRANVLHYPSLTLPPSSKRALTEKSHLGMGVGMGVGVHSDNKQIQLLISSTYETNPHNWLEHTWRC